MPVLPPSKAESLVQRQKQGLHLLLASSAAVKSRNCSNVWPLRSSVSQGDVVAQGLLTEDFGLLTPQRARHTQDLARE